MRSTEGRTARRAYGAAALGVAALFLWAPAASAAEKPRVDRQAWARTGPLAPPAPTPGNIYVSAVAGQEQARSYLHFDVPNDDEAELGDSVVELREGGDGVLSENAVLTACPLTKAFEGSGEFTGELPAEDCSIHLSLKRAADGTWSLPLRAFAHTLITGRSAGLAIMPDPAAGSTSTVSFDTFETRIAQTEAAKPDLGGASTPSGGRRNAGAFSSPPQMAASPSEEVALPSGGSAYALPAPAAGAGAPAPAPGPSSIPSARSAPMSAGSPPAVIILIPLAIAAVALWARGRFLPAVPLERAVVPTRSLTTGAAWAAAVALAMVASEATAYRFGLIAIVFVGAIGLHILVNWAGELSLAHAAFIALPAFVVAQVSAHTGASPIVVLPLGVIIGAMLGLIIAVAALRARGLQVALVTLAAGIGIDRFLFVRSWVIGPPGGLDIPVPSLFGIRFETSRSMIPVVVIIVLVAALACRALLDSKVGRALSLVKANPDAAMAVGIPVAFYRGIAYALAGAFAGLAGSSYVLWVQQVSPKAFPLDLGFSYLVIAVLAGKGGLAGLGLAAFFLEGGRLFSIIPQSIALYLGPIALIYNVTRYQEGLNGLLHESRHWFANRREVALMAIERATGAARRGVKGTAVRLPVVVASLIVVAGFTSLILAWYHAGNTDQLWVQNQEIVSGGLGGLALIVFGSTLLIRDALIHGRSVVGRPSESTAEIEPHSAAADGFPVEPATKTRRRRPVSGSEGTA